MLKGMYLVMFFRSCGYSPAAMNCQNCQAIHGAAMAAAQMRLMRMKVEKTSAISSLWSWVESPYF
jgi:hypothetical protein